MFDLFGFAKKIFTQVSDYLAPATHYLSETSNSVASLFYGRPLAEINFDRHALCPPDLSDQQTQEWVSVYLERFEGNNLLLWANRKDELMLSYSQNQEVIHARLKDYTVDCETKQIFYDAAVVTSLNVIAAELDEKRGNTFNLDIQLPLLDDLRKRHKLPVYLYQNVITPEILQELEAKKLKLTQDCESNVECTICYNKYDSNNPAIILVESGNIYHQNCLQTYFSKNPRGAVDPISNVALKSGNMISARGYMALVSDEQSLIQTLEMQTKAISILRTENEALKAQLQQHASNPPSPFILTRQPSVESLTTEPTALRNGQSPCRPS